MTRTLSQARTRRKDAGFSLIELLVVVTILAILAVIAIPVFVGQRAKAQDAAAADNVAKLAGVIRTGFSVGSETPPAVVSSEIRWSDPGAGASSMGLGAAAATITDSDAWCVTQAGGTTTFHMGPTDARPVAGALPQGCPNPPTPVTNPPDDPGGEGPIFTGDALDGDPAVAFGESLRQGILAELAARGIGAKGDPRLNGLDMPPERAGNFFGIAPLLYPPALQAVDNFTRWRLLLGDASDNAGAADLWTGGWDSPYGHTGGWPIRYIQGDLAWPGPQDRPGGQRIRPTLTSISMSEAGKFCFILTANGVQSWLFDQDGFRGYTDSPSLARCDTAGTAHPQTQGTQPVTVVWNDPIPQRGGQDADRLWVVGWPRQNGSPVAGPPLACSTVNPVGKTGCRIDRGVSGFSYHFTVWAHWPGAGWDVVNPASIVVDVP